MQEKYTDPIDVASQTGQNFVDDSVNDVRRLVPEKREEPEEDYECSNCGSTHPEFPRERYERGYDLCVPCQRDIEKYSKQYYRGRAGHDD